MTDIVLHLQYETDHKQYHLLFATFSELKNTVISFFKIPKHERNNLNFAFEYENTTLYIQDDSKIPKSDFGTFAKIRKQNTAYNLG